MTEKREEANEQRTELERGADKEVKRRKCPLTSGNGKGNEKRNGMRIGESEWKQEGGGRDLEPRAYISREEKEEEVRSRKRLSDEMRDRSPPRDKTDFLVAIFSQLSFHKSENILRRRYFRSVCRQ